MNDLVSVIIPVYNAGQHLKECLNSIIKQTYTNLEIIIIDDGSSDNSLQISKEFQERDSRIVVYQERNSGVSVARNTGLDKSHGKWICFIDSDDIVVNNYLEKLLSVVKEVQEAGLVSCRIGYIGMQSKEYDIHGSITSPIVEVWNCRADYQNKLVGSVCGRIFLRDIVDGIRFSSDLTVGEDSLFCSEVALEMLFPNQTLKGVMISDPLYLYRINMNSATTKTFSIRYLDQIKSADEICKLWRTHFPEDIYWMENLRIEAQFMVLKKIVESYSFKKNKEVFNSIKTDILNENKYKDKRLSIKVQTILVKKSAFLYRVFVHCYCMFNNEMSRRKKNLKRGL